MIQWAIVIEKNEQRKEKQHYIEHFTPSKMIKTRGIYKILFFFRTIIAHNLENKRGETNTNYVTPKGITIN